MFNVYRLKKSNGDHKVPITLSHPANTHHTHPHVLKFVLMKGYVFFMIDILRQT